MTYSLAKRLLPGWFLRHVYHFEAAIEAAVRRFSASLPPHSLVLDAGAGEMQYAHCFTAHRYIGVDLGIGDSQWNYSHLDVLADLNRLPFRDSSFHAAVNIVTLEHLADPQLALNEIARTLAPGGSLLLVAPMEWEVHQAPHDFFRYTRHGLELLLIRAGFSSFTIEPVGGLFRLLARRLLNAVQILPFPLNLIAALVFIPLALVLPVLDPLDRAKSFTLGYQCLVRKS